MKTVELPPISIPAADHRRLTALVDAGRAPTQVLDYLSEELSRADVVDDAECSPHVVRIGSLVSYRDGENGRSRTVRLVWPMEADVTKDRISVLSPVGAALLGMSAGQSISWPQPAGEPRMLTVETVHGVDAPDPAA